MRWLRSLDIPPDFAWVESLAVIAVAVVAALVAHAVLMRVAGHAARRATHGLKGGAEGSEGSVVPRVRQPLRWVFVTIAVGFAARLLRLTDGQEATLKLVFGFVTPALLGWLALAALRGTIEAVTLRADISVEDNLRARRKRTRAAILGRIGSFFIVFVTVCLMLLSVPGIRTIGVTLMASAGIAGLVVGAAAQPALKNLIAGVQMAFTEPIRLDDVLIIDGEWGRVEEIRLTFVVIKLWDERRLIVPVSKFLEESFQNWTRETSQLMGSVFWYLDPSADVPRLRARLEEIIAANPRWDRRFWNLQVTDMKADAVELRALVTAKNASIAFDLRCDVREALLAYIHDEMPEALPRRRTIVEGEGVFDPPLAGEVAGRSPDGGV